MTIRARVAGQGRWIGAMIVAIVVMIATVALGGNTAGAQASPTLLQELEAAEARWEAAGIVAYQFSYSEQCYCGSQGTALYTVVDGVVTQASISPDLPERVPAGLSVEQMFDKIRETLAVTNDVTASFDPVVGYPTQFMLRPSLAPVDGHYGITVSGLVIGSTPLTCDGKAVTMIGSNGADELRGSRFVDVIMAFGGDDVVIAGLGSDTICGGSGDDRIYGDTGIESVANLVYNLDDVILGGAGRDRIYGESGNDRLIGGDDIDYLWGGGGIDRIEGNGGSDRMRGGSGGDDMFGGSGADRMWGNGGDDEMFGQGGQDQMWGGPGDDVLQGNWQSDLIWGGDGFDTLAGAEGKDTLRGGAGGDTIYGGKNTDVLYGGAGLDALAGGPGTDTLHGGLDADVLNGGPHTDTCYRGGTDDLVSCQVREWELADTWYLSEYQTPGQTVMDINTLTELRLDTNSQTGLALSSCNRGEVSLTAGTTASASGAGIRLITATEAACVGLLDNTFDPVFFGVLANGASVTLDQRRMVITGTFDGEPTSLHFVRANGSPVDNWRLLNSVPSLPGGQTPWITMSVSRTTISGSTGCNSFSADRRVLVPFGIGAISSTEIACAPDLAFREAAFFDMLAKVDSYAAYDDILRLTGPGVDLQFEYDFDSGG